MRLPILFMRLPVVFLLQLYDGQTWFVKVHATFPALEKGAEDLLIRMPIKVIKLMIYTDRFSLSLSSLSLSLSPSGS